MSFDLSRVRFDPRKGFAGVIMQQGRVQLDADWNEWVAQVGRRNQAGALDMLGPAAVPSETPNGFLIRAEEGGLTIGPGRIYVDGLLAENHGAAHDEWNQRLAEECGTASTPFLEQPYLPFNETNIEDPPASALNGPALVKGTYLVYVDVWQRDVTHLQDPDLVEQAVGVDSTGRLQTVWQVKVLEIGTNITRETDDKDIPGWLDATRPSGGRLSTSIGAPPGEPEPCQLPPQAGYRGGENQLYRVEIHQGGPVGEATFKWSRDNASVATRVTHINGTQLRVESVGRDDVLRFHDGDWVEITDDWYELHNLPGQLRRIRVGQGVNDAGKTINLEAELDAAFPVASETGATDPGRHTVVRRWDQSGTVQKEDGSFYADLGGTEGEIPVPPSGSKLHLESGILVEFHLHAGADNKWPEFKSGDYWVFAARTTDPSLEILDKVPPRGIHHHYAKLAVVTLPNGAPDDLRTLWPPLQKGPSRGCCTLTVGQGGDCASIQEAVDRLPRDTGGRICLLPGEHAGAQIDTRSHVSIVGCGLASIVGPAPMPGSTVDIVAGEMPAAFVIVGESYDISLSNMHVAGEIRVDSGKAIRICDNHIGIRTDVQEFTSFEEVAVHVAAEDVLIARNSVVVGGVEVAAGSSRIRVVDNVIQGGSGNGITLGSAPVEFPKRHDDLQLAPTVEAGQDGVVLGVATLTEPAGPSPAVGAVLKFTHKDVIQQAVTDASGRFRVAIQAASPGEAVGVELVRPPGLRIGAIKSGNTILLEQEEAQGVGWAFLRDITIERNRITGMGWSGIGLPRPPASSAEAVSERGDLSRGIVPFLTSLLAQSGPPIGGLTIVGNDIRENFKDRGAPVRNRGLGGITLGFCRDLRIRDNRIESNGIEHSVPTCGVFLTYGEDVELTGNRIVNNGTLEPEEPELSWGGGVVLAMVTSLPVLGLLTGGERATPAALSVRPAARIHDNVVDQPGGRALYVMAYGLITCTDNHLSNERAGVSSRDRVGSTVFILNAGGMPASLVKQRMPEQVWADGHTLFAHNQVTSLDSRRVSARQTYSVLASQALLGWDDVEYEGNQSTWLGENLFCDVGLAAQTLRASGNRLRESGDDLVSLATVTPGWGNAATYNQADHCVIAITIAPQTVADAAGNRQLRVYGDQCRTHERTLRALFTPLFGGALEDVLTGRSG